MDKHDLISEKNALVIGNLTVNTFLLLILLFPILFMEPAKKFLDLIVWQKAHRYILQVYHNTSKFPKEEIFGLTSQYRKASISIAANC